MSRLILTIPGYQPNPGDLVQLAVGGGPGPMTVQSLGPGPNLVVCSWSAANKQAQTGTFNLGCLNLIAYAPQSVQVSASGVLTTGVGFLNSVTVIGPGASGVNLVLFDAASVATGAYIPNDVTLGGGWGQDSLSPVILDTGWQEIQLSAGQVIPLGPFQYAAGIVVASVPAGGMFSLSFSQAPT